MRTQREKIEKIAIEMEALDTRITELQERYSVLERRKKELENTEILELVEKASLSPEALAEFLHKLKETRNATPIITEEHQNEE